MLNNRLQTIVNRVDHLGAVSVKELAESLGVAVETIRRDLRILESQGHLKRSHGGAISISGDDIGLAFGKREQEQTEEKRQISVKALGLIHAGDTIMLDASSSSWYLARSLPDQELTVITNSLRITFELAGKKKIKTLTVGGEYSEKYAAFLGPITTAQIAEFSVDTLFFSCTGYQQDTGAWESNEPNAALKKMMLKSCNKSVLLCDSSKMGKSGLIRLCQHDEISHIITE